MKELVKLIKINDKLFDKYKSGLYLFNAEGGLQNYEGNVRQLKGMGVYLLPKLKPIKSFTGTVVNVSLTVIEMSIITDFGLITSPRLNNIKPEKVPKWRVVFNSSSIHVVGELKFEAQVVFF